MSLCSEPVALYYAQSLMWVLKKLTCHREQCIAAELPKAILVLCAGASITIPQLCPR
ncbi:MAG: hypothetical protein ACD_62C00229G0002 [uncultured bacterium]|nr:MAG: hypothetical protein ACD_62C00229G0002 [uncultured bacterium]